MTRVRPFEGRLGLVPDAEPAEAGRAGRSPCTTRRWPGCCGRCSPAGRGGSSRRPGRSSVLRGWVVREGRGGCLDARAHETAERVLDGLAGPVVASPTARTGAVDPGQRPGAPAGVGGVRRRSRARSTWSRRCCGCPGPPARTPRGCGAAGRRQPVRGLARRRGASTGCRSRGYAGDAGRRHRPAVGAHMPAHERGRPGGGRPALRRATRPRSWSGPSRPSRALSEVAPQEWWEAAAAPPRRCPCWWPSPSTARSWPPTCSCRCSARPGSARPEVAETLALLPEAGGPTGVATAAAVGWGAASGSDLAARTAAADALRGFAARGGLDARAAGGVAGRAAAPARRVRRAGRLDPVRGGPRRRRRVAPGLGAARRRAAGGAPVGAPGRRRTWWAWRASSPPRSGRGGASRASTRSPGPAARAWPRRRGGCATSSPAEVTVGEQHRHLRRSADRACTASLASCWFHAVRAGRPGTRASAPRRCRRPPVVAGAGPRPPALSAARPSRSRPRPAPRGRALPHRIPAEPKGASHENRLPRPRLPRRRSSSSSRPPSSPGPCPG